MIQASEDRKVQGRKGQLNSFGLLPGLPCNGGTCPGMTTGSQGCCHEEQGKRTWHCYAARLAAFRPAIFQQLAHNTQLLQKARASGKEQYLLCEFVRFLAQEKRAAKPWRNYRLHWSGDIFNEEYAEALRSAMARFPEIFFWTYTRSFFAVPILAGLANLRLYLSLDEKNRDTGISVYNKWQRAGNISLSIMAKTHPPGKFLPCPVDSGKMPQPLSCSRCRLCLVGKPVWFFMR